MTYPIKNMIQDLLTPQGDCLPEDLVGLTDDEIIDLYDDTFY